MAEIKQRSSGTTFREISKRNFRVIKVIVPPSEIIGRFDVAIEPLYRQIRESHTLANLRDTLLPKLMSGQLRIPAAQEVIP